MMLTLKKRRTIETEGRVISTRQYRTEKQVREALSVALGRIHLIRDRVHGLSYDDFLLDSDLVQLCATDYMIIGNQLGQLDNVLIDRDFRKDVYDFRSVVAHCLGTEEFNVSLLWESIVYDLDRIESACLMAMAILDRAEIIRFENRRATFNPWDHPF